MKRWMPYTAATALMLGGCAGLGSACSDCVPPKTLGIGYCSPKDRWITKQTARGCAARDLKELYGKRCKRSGHFADGFEAAYVDVALGKTPAVPPVPPPTYWNAFYRSCAGEDAVQDWFDGYAAGLEASRHHGVSGFNQISSSWSGGLGANGAACGP
ncbi:MAG TPA: hypothetical protein VFG20_08540 [Planctomycetaceae bacterium]|nr:hypothetical protein [Planctomycetaceae bacterium]